MSGRRNEVARKRRRSHVKRAMSLTSVPKSEDDAVGVSTAPLLNLSNHFTWEVLQKSQIGDGTFPHIFQFYEKPDLHGRDFDKVTYVLYMDKGTVVDKQSDIQREGTQTAVSGILVSEKPSPPQEYYKQTIVQQPYYEEEIQPSRPKVAVATEENIMYLPDRRKKKKLISEFYFVRRDRSRSRSAGDRTNKDVVYSDGDWQSFTPEGSKTHLTQIDHSISESEKSVMKEKDRAVLGWKKTKNDLDDAVKSGTKDNYYADQHQRAGAENIEREYIELKEKYKTSRTSSVVRKKSSKVMEFVKFKVVKHDDIAEELLKTSSGTNQYLYVPRKTRQR